MKFQYSQLLTATTAVSLSFLTASTQAENTPAFDEEVIVTATRVEQPLKASLPTAHVITALDIERLQPRDLPSLLGTLGGVDFTDSGGRGSSSGVFMRGTTSSQIIVLIDGVRSASATTGATALENIPLRSIDRIEVVKGPLSGLYGADALGGVIQVFTRQASTSTLDASLGAGYGGNRSKNYNATLGGGNDRRRFLLSFSKEDTDGIDRTDLKINGNEDHDSYEEKSGNISASFAVTESLQARLNYLRSAGRTEFDNVFGTDTGRFSEGELKVAGASLLYQANEKLNLTLDLGYLSDHSVTPVFSSDFHTRRNSASLQSDYQVNSNHLLTLGADYYDDDVTTRDAFVETERNNKGYFIQWQGNLNAAKLVTSLRYDDNEAYGDDTNGTIALAVPVGDSLEIVASYGTAFKAPSFNDLYFPTFGNPYVLPEESKTFEVSLRGSRNAVDWRINTYRNNVKNLIGFDLSTFTANNIANAVLEGVELEAGLTVDEWRISSSVDYLEARDEATHEWLEDRALVSAGLRVDRQFNQWYLGIDVKAEHGRHDHDEARLSGFAIWGISSVYDINDRLKLSGRVDNLFDKNYTLNLATSSVAYETEGRVARISLEYHL